MLLRVDVILGGYINHITTHNLVVLDRIVIVVVDQIVYVMQMKCFRQSVLSLIIVNGRAKVLGLYGLMVRFKFQLTVVDIIMGLGDLDMDQSLEIIKIVVLMGVMVKEVQLYHVMIKTRDIYLLVTKMMIVSHVIIATVMV